MEKLGNVMKLSNKTEQKTGGAAEVTNAWKKNTESGDTFEANEDEDEDEVEDADDGKGEDEAENVKTRWKVKKLNQNTMMKMMKQTKRNVENGNKKCVECIEVSDDSSSFNCK